MGKLICNNKKYRTREGLVVVIDRKRVKQSAYPVKGRVESATRGSLGLSWTEDGYYFHRGDAHRHNLVEVEK